MESDFRKPLFKLIKHFCGKKQSACAVVMPSADSVELLEAHLKKLCSQTTSDFDVVIVGKPPIKVPQRLNVLVFRELHALGSSGGFGVGQALAYSLGYDYVINADADCLPVSANLIERLVECARDEGIAIFPQNIEYGGGEERGCSNQYGIVNRNFLEKVGFLQFTLYRGSEDYDMYERLKMEGLSRAEMTLFIRHKTENLNYIPLLLNRNNKYIYYKRSFVAANILLAHYAFSKFRLLRGLGYFLKALAEAVKTQLFYSQYPEITRAVYDALLAKQDSVFVARTSQIKTIVQENGMPRAVLAIDGEGGAAGRSAVFFAQKKEPLAALRLAWQLVSLNFKSCDFLCPSRAFMMEYERMVPILLWIKPVKYTDGCIYTSGMGRLAVIAHIAKTALLIPAFAVVLAVSIASVSGRRHPITLSNLAENLDEFIGYVMKLDAEGRKLRGRL